MSQDFEVEFEQAPKTVVDGDVRVEMRLKNSRLWEAIHKNFPSVSAFCKGEDGMSDSEVGRLINLKRSPYKVVKGWRTSEYLGVCLKVAAKLGLPPEYLFPDELYEKFVGKKTTGAVTVSSLNLAEVDYKTLLLAPAPEESGISEFDLSELRDKLDEALGKLSTHYRQVVEMRHGLNGHQESTWEEIGNALKVTKSCVQQFYVRAMNKLRLEQAKKLEGCL